MSRSSTRGEPTPALRTARRRAEARLGELRRALDDELGLASPRRPGLWLLLGAGAVGLALGAGGWAARRRQKRLD